MGQIVSDVTSLLEHKNQKKAAESERQKVLKQMQADETAKTNLVKKVLATQRANYGASGMSGKSMSEGAVLKRLRTETEEPFEEKKKNNLAKYNSIKAPKSNLLSSILRLIH